MKKSELKKIIKECLNEASEYEEIPEEIVNAAITSLFEIMRDAMNEIMSADKKATGGKNKSKINKAFAIAGKSIESIKGLF